VIFPKVIKLGRNNVYWTKHDSRQHGWINNKNESTTHMTKYK